MKKLSSLSLLTMLGLLTLNSFNWKTQELPTEKVNWLTWQEAVSLNKENPKKIFIDVYTDWCGWCKRMDASTFSDPKVVKYLKDNFYAVKFDAEQKEDIEFNGHTFTFIKRGRRGVHTLAAALLDGRLGYPSVVYLNEKFERIATSPGYKGADAILKELTFAAEEHYKTSSWEEYFKTK